VSRGWGQTPFSAARQWAQTEA